MTFKRSLHEAELTLSYLESSDASPSYLNKISSFLSYAFHCSDLFNNQKLVHRGEVMKLVKINILSSCFENVVFNYLLYGCNES